MGDKTPGIVLGFTFKLSWGYERITVCAHAGVYMGKNSTIPPRCDVILERISPQKIETQKFTRRIAAVMLSECVSV